MEAGLLIFHWDDENRAHIARHGVSEAQAQSAFGAEDAAVFPDATRLNRWVLEACVEDRTIKVAFARVFPEGYRIITAHWMSFKRRRTP
jgi:uncharacterized DUF497 family protein